MFGGQVGIGDHVTIGDDARIAAKAAVFKDLPAGGSYMGSPARPITKVQREHAALTLLGALPIPKASAPPAWAFAGEPQVP